MAEKKYSPPKNLINPFLKDLDEYKSMYHQSIDDPQAFFGKQAEENLTWIGPL
jgi:acetyl-CoA synthetase